MSQPTTEQQIQIKGDDVILRGVYSNLVNVSNTKEEFVMDFLNIVPPAGTLNARVIMSPGHVKRLAALLTRVVAQYESNNGNITPADEPKQEIGFATK